MPSSLPDTADSHTSSGGLYSAKRPMKRGVNQSPPRAMVIAEYYLDLDQEEMARIFGVRRGTVAATLAQARARMRTGGKDAS